jgi:hypothetical protein
MRIGHRLAGAAFACLLLAAEGAGAQAVPTVLSLPRTSAPGMPSSELKLSCPPGPDSLAVGTNCPVLQWSGYLYWIFTRNDNALAMRLVGYDADQQIVFDREWNGARYPWSISVDAAAQTVTLHGQANQTITLSWDDLSIYKPVHRYYLDSARTHFLTTVKTEGDAFVANGWREEGICCRILATPSPGSVVLFRRYNDASRDHLYTTNAAEKPDGFVDEIIPGLVYPAPRSGAVPLFRLFRISEVRLPDPPPPDKGCLPGLRDPLPIPKFAKYGDHFYTIDAAERQNAIANLGYADEGIAGYVFAP